MTVSLNGSASQDIEAPARPKYVGILAMEMYFPKRVRIQRVFSPFDASLYSCAGAVHLGGGARGVRQRP